MLQLTTDTTAFLGGRPAVLPRRGGDDRDVFQLGHVVGQLQREAWAKSAVRAILRNPRYTGRLVWNRQRRDEELLDVDDVALGHQTKLRWNDRSDWIWSAEETHEAIITPELFARAQEQRIRRAADDAERSPHG